MDEPKELTEASLEAMIRDIAKAAANRGERLTIRPTCYLLTGRWTPEEVAAAKLLMEKSF